MTGRKNNPDLFLTTEEARQVEVSIQEAEKQTAAQIKLMIVRHCWDKIERKAAALFCRHGLYVTRQRNAVLILLVTSNREFLVYGDQGIHEKVGQAFWDNVRTEMADFFRDDQFGPGLCAGIRRIGEKLVMYFPPVKDNPNELSDEIICEN